MSEPLPPLYQMLEDAVLELLEDKLALDDLTYYAYESDRKVETPCIIVSADSVGQDPPHSPIYAFDVAVMLRASEDEMTRETFGGIYSAITAILEDSVALAAALTSGRLYVYGCDYDEDAESELEGSSIERVFPFRCLATCVASNLSAVADVTPGDGDEMPADNDVMGTYYADPAGVSGNAGTSASPWDLVSALDGTQTIPSGSTLVLKDGTYNNLSGTYLRNWDIALDTVTVQPATIRGAVVQGGWTLLATSNAVTIKGIEFSNPDAVPGGEPTASGTPTPSPKPTAWDEWGGVGVTVEGGAGHIIANCVIHDGIQGIICQQGPTGNTKIYGNIVYDNGWLATDRGHGHGIYIQSTAPATKTLKHNFFTTRDGRANSGQVPLHAYGTNARLDNISMTYNGMKGGMVGYSENVEITNMTFTNNVTIAIRADLGYNGLQIGKTGNADNLVNFSNNTMLNIRKNVENRGITNLTQAGNRVFAINPTVYAWTGLESGETEGTYTDLTTAGGTDEAHVWINEYDATRAHVVILDLDKDNAVTVDLSSLLATNDTYEIYHYRNFENGATPDQTGTYTGPVAISLVESVGTDRGDFFVVIATAAAVLYDYYRPGDIDSYLRPGGVDTYKHA